MYSGIQLADKNGALRQTATHQEGTGETKRTVPKSCLAEYRFGTVRNCSQPKKVRFPRDGTDGITRWGNSSLFILTVGNMTDGVLTCKLLHRQAKVDRKRRPFTTHIASTEQGSSLAHKRHSSEPQAWIHAAVHHLQAHS